MRREHESVAGEELGRGRRRGRIMRWAVAGLVVLVLLLFGRGLAGTGARYLARRAMDRFTFSQALVWLQRADWVDPHEGRTALAYAACYRQLGEIPRHDEYLALAKEYGASDADVSNEAELMKIQQGELAAGVERKLSELTEAGMSPHDVASAFIQGYLAAQNTEQAQALLGAWEADYPGHPHVLYMRGILLRAANDQAGAGDAFEQALASEPGHELAQLALAKLAESNKQLAVALTRYVQLAGLLPDNANVLVGLARVLRLLGRHEQARTVLTQVPDSSSPLSAVECEWGQLELETGDYASATRRFEHVSAQDMTDHQILAAAGLALGLSGKTLQADRAFLWIADEITSISLIYDLQHRLAVYPANQDAKTELQNLMRSLSGRANEGNPYELALAENATPATDELPGMQLYEEQCGACHGTNGDGRGRATRNLFPLPRDLRTEPMRLVSTDNGIPSRDDIKRVMRSGVPGTSMAARDQLTDTQLDQLTDVVLTLRRDGVREEYVALLHKEGEPVDQQEVGDVVRLHTTPGRTVVVPPIEPADASSATAGKDLYVQHTCHSCHGETGTGDELIPLFDTRGQPSFPRDLVHDLFKGGNDAASIYLRIRLGMPGSPHPANTVLTDQQLIDLTRYCLSLGREPKNNFSNHERSIQASKRPAFEFRELP